MKAPATVTGGGEAIILSILVEPGVLYLRIPGETFPNVNWYRSSGHNWFRIHEKREILILQDHYLSTLNPPEIIENPESQS